jgi:hypothetical protein
MCTGSRIRRPSVGVVIELTKHHGLDLAFVAARNVKPQQFTVAFICKANIGILHSTKAVQPADVRIDVDNKRDFSNSFGDPGQIDVDLLLVVSTGKFNAALGA